MLNQSQKPSPVVAPALAPAVEPLLQNSHRLEVKLPHARVVAADPIVVVVTSELLVQSLEERTHGPVPMLSAPEGEPGQGLAQAPPRRPAL